jgi:hypothetical protein
MMLNDVKAFGALGDGVTDDRAKIQAAIDDAVANHKGGILIPSGEYRLSYPNGARGSLDLNGVQDFMVLGEGPKSVVKLRDTPPPPETGDWHVFLLRNDCRRVVFKDLVIDGNRTGLTHPDEQSHGVEVESGTEDLVIDRCTVRECFGDGIRLAGTDQVGKTVRRVRIQNCLFQTNNRSGLSIQRAIEQIIVAHCHFDANVSDQSIDFEPTGSGGPTNLIIQGCIINHTNPTKAVTLSGIKGPDPLFNCKFTDNIVLGGPISCSDVNQLTIQNNTVLVTHLGTTVERIPVQVQRGGDAVIISGNLLVNDDTITEAVISLSEANQRQVTRALVANNLCFARSGNGIQCLSSDDVAVQGNMIVASDACRQGVFIRSESSDMDHISVRDNDVTVKENGAWDTGICIASTAPNQIRDVSVTANSVHGAAEGIRFENAHFEGTPVCALNRIGADVAAPLLGFPNLPEHAVVVGGALSRGGTAAASGAGRVLVGLGSPDGKVVGNVGDMFQQLDGIPGKTLYVKEAGNGTNTDWKSK